MNKQATGTSNTSSLRAPCDADDSLVPDQLVDGLPRPSLWTGISGVMGCTASCLGSLGEVFVLGLSEKLIKAQ